MTESEWQLAERRRPDKQYVDVEPDPEFRDPATRWAIACFIAAALCALGLAWPWLPG